jgi:C4-dicarboxylate-specific signal transduction histidine kinase
MEELLAVSSRDELRPQRQRPVKVKGLVDALRDVYQERLNAKGLRLWTEIPDGVQVLALEEALRDTVLGRLLGQAIQASPPGSDLELNAVEAGAWIELRLSDQGAGMPAGLGRSLLRPHEAEGWAGLGNSLALVRDTLAQMGGELRLAEAQGGGTPAVVRLRPCSVPR